MSNRPSSSRGSRHDKEYYGDDYRNDGGRPRKSDDKHRNSKGRQGKNKDERSPTTSTRKLYDGYNSGPPSRGGFSTKERGPREDGSRGGRDRGGRRHDHGRGSKNVSENDTHSSETDGNSSRESSRSDRKVPGK